MRKLHGLRLRHPATNREWHAHTDLDMDDRDLHVSLTRHLVAMARRHDGRDQRETDFASEYELDVIESETRAVLVTWSCLGDGERR